MLRKHKDGPWREAYRPAGFDEFSPTTNVASLKAHLTSKSRSQTYMFHGETGTGKTTMAYIIGKIINCEASTNNGPCNKCKTCLQSELIFEDRNMGDETGIDATRDIINRIQEPPLVDIKRIVILDEAHALTKSAQKAWLKVLEDPKPWLYVFFCTTDHGKFLPDLRNRCHQVEFRRLNQTESVSLMLELASLEKVKLTKEQAEEIFQKVGGRPRELINAVQAFSNGGEIEIPKEEALKAQIKELVDGILEGALTRTSWDTLWGNYLKLLDGNDGNAEGLRRMILWWLWMYAENKNNWARKFRLTRIMNVMDIFSRPTDGDDAKYQFVVMMFRAWKHDDSDK